MADPEFGEFPFAYRVSQQTMILSVVILIISGKLRFAAWPLIAKWVLLGSIGAMVLFALGTTSYVVLRYPYISLVQARDGDIFSRHFGSRFAVRLLKFLGTVTSLVLSVMFTTIFVTGKVESVTGLVLAVYTTVLFFCVAYLSLRYEPDSFPATATYIRATLGLGIVLMPIFLPVLIIGGRRCKSLLDQEIARQQNAVDLSAARGAGS